MKSIDDIIAITRNSAFNRQNYKVNIKLKRFREDILLHTDSTNSEDKKEFNREDWFKRIVPPFQRDNDKWTKVMKLKFVENILKGVSTDLLFFCMKDERISPNGEDSQIIDGLQRLTAINDFFDGIIKPFGYSYEELKDSISMNKFKTNISISIYTFESWKDVGNFYIEMNENISHSKDDIQKAKDWFMDEFNINLDLD